MRNKKITLEEYCKIKVDIEYVFFFFLNSKKKIHISNTQNQLQPLQNSQVYNVRPNIKIIIADVIQYKM